MHDLFCAAFTFEVSAFSCLNLALLTYQQLEQIRNVWAELSCCCFTLGAWLALYRNGCFRRLHLRSLGFFLFELGFADLPAAGTDTQRMGGAQLLLLHVGCVVGIVQKWLFPLCLR